MEPPALPNQTPKTRATPERGAIPPASVDNYFWTLWRTNQDLFYSILASYSFYQISKIVTSILPQVQNNYDFWAALYRARFGRTMERRGSFAETYRRRLILSKFQNLSPQELNKFVDQDLDSINPNQETRDVLENPELDYEDLLDLIDNDQFFQLQVILKAIEANDIDLLLFAKQDETSFDSRELITLLEGDHRDLVEDYLEALTEEQFRDFLSGTLIRFLVVLPTRKSREEQDCNLDLIKAKFALQPSSQLKINPYDYAVATHDAWNENCQQALDYLLEKLDLLDEEQSIQFAQKLAELSTFNNNFELADWVLSEYGLAVFDFRGITHWHDPQIVNELYQTNLDQFESYFYELIRNHRFRVLNNILINTPISPELAKPLLMAIAEQRGYNKLKPSEYNQLITVANRLSLVLPSSTVDGIVERSNNSEFKDLIMETID